MLNRKIISYFILFILLFSFTVNVLAERKIIAPGFEYFYDDLEFETDYFYEGRFSILLPSTDALKRTKFLTRCEYELAMRPLFDKRIGRTANSGIYINIGIPYEFRGQYFYTKVYEQTTIARREHPYSTVEYQLILKDKADETLKIRVRLGGANKYKEEKGYYEKRLSENRKIFEHIKNSLRIQTEDGKYVKPEIIKLKDKIYDKTEAAKEAMKISSRELRLMVKGIDSAEEEEKIWKQERIKRYEAYLKSKGYDLNKIEYVM